MSCTHIYSASKVFTLPAICCEILSRTGSLLRPGREVERRFDKLALKMTESQTQELLRSHNELRAALIFAGRRIRKLTFGRKDDPVLPILRKVLQDARTVARQHKIQGG